MTKQQKIIFFVALLFMSVSLILPIWRIEIWAPQYPEWLTLQIFASHMAGNVDQINILNHYIGMQHIVPDQIPELQIIPWVLTIILVTGLLLLFFAKKLLLPKIWFGLTILLSLLGFYDFYLWGYRYGHNLHPDAPIKIPGMTYQPPLLGYKKILNIEAYSIPDISTYALTIGFLLIFLVLFWEPIKKNWKKFFSPALILFFFVSCTNKPEPLRAHKDNCDNCHMQVTDTRFGAEIITTKGRIYKFDSINCLQEYLKKNQVTPKSIYVADYKTPDTLLKAEDAFFLNQSKIAGPMGPGPIASKNKSFLDQLSKNSSGKVTNWKELSH